MPVANACEAMAEFKGIKRRMEVIGEINGIMVYDDFAHHPTAITETLSAARERAGANRILAILEPRSNTMRMGVHKDELIHSLQAADAVYIYEPDNLDWDLKKAVANSSKAVAVYSDTQDIIDVVCETAENGDHILIMSNGGFESLHPRLLKALQHAQQVKQSA